MSDPSTPQADLPKIGTAPEVHQARITVVNRLYFQSPDMDPTCLSSGYTRKVVSGEQPWSRTFKVGEAWQPLDLGWYDGQLVGLLVLTNERERFEQGRPSEEDKLLAAAKVVEVGLLTESPETKGRDMHSPDKAAPQVVSLWVLPPGETQPGQPAQDIVARLRVRCRAGTARCTLTLFPL